MWMALFAARSPPLFVRSYRATLRELDIGDRQETGRCANNSAENSPQPFRRWERAILRFRWMRTLQKFASVHGSVHNHFNKERSLSSRAMFKLTVLPLSQSGAVSA